MLAQYLGLLDTEAQFSHDRAPYSTCQENPLAQDYVGDLIAVRSKLVGKRRELAAREAKVSHLEAFVTKIVMLQNSIAAIDVAINEEKTALPAKKAKR